MLDLKKPMGRGRDAEAELLEHELNGGLKVTSNGGGSALVEEDSAQTALGGLVTAKEHVEVRKLSN